MKKEYNSLILIIFCTFILIVGFFKFLLSPVNKKISNLEKKIIEKTQELQKTRVLAEKFSVLKEEIKLLQKEIEIFEKRVPKETNLPELLKIVSKEAENYNVKISKLEKQVENLSPPEFKEIPFVIYFKCNYHNLGQFLSVLAQNKRIFTGTSLNLRYSFTGTPTRTDNFIEGDCTLFAYSLK